MFLSWLFPICVLFCLESCSSKSLIFRLTRPGFCVSLTDEHDAKFVLFKVSLLAVKSWHVRGGCLSAAAVVNAVTAELSEQWSATINRGCLMWDGNGKRKSFPDFRSIWDSADESVWNSFIFLRLLFLCLTPCTNAKRYVFMIKCGPQKSADHWCPRCQTSELFNNRGTINNTVWPKWTMCPWVVEEKNVPKRNQWTKSLPSSQGSLAL